MQLKRIGVLMVIIALLICSMPMLALPVSAAWYKDGYYTYSVTDGKATIEDVDTAISGSITTPATLGGYPVVEIADDAFSRCNNLTSVTVNSSVTFIGKRAFANCANLTTLVIPNGASITNASWQICEYCSKLTNVTLGNGIRVIPQWAFQYCTSLTNIVIPNGVTDIYMAAFANCTNLTTVILPASVTYIGSSSFSDTNLTSVYYGGTEAQKKNIDIQNSTILNATWYYSYTPISITRQPSSVTVADGQTAMVSFSASGNGLTYKWYYKDKTAGSFTRDTGFSGNSYSVTMSAAVDGRRVYCIVTDTYGKSVQTNTVTLSRKVEPVKITKQPENVTVAAGETAATTFTASGDGLSYQWYCKKKGDAYFSADNSTSGNTYRVIMDVHSDGKQVYCIVTDQYGNRAQTNTVTLSMSGCNHQYDEWTSIGESMHQRTCSVCKGTISEVHSWGNGTVTKQPSCKESGIKTYTCAGCGGTKAEEIAKTNNHQYGKWILTSESEHKRTCSICDKTEISAHSWDAGIVTKQPTCKEAGIKTYTCSVCGGTKTEEIAKTNDHEYGKWILTSESEHKRTCSICDKTEISTHNWDAGIVTKQPTCKEAGIKTYTCSVCGGTKTEEIAKTDNHKYGSWGSVDDAKHSHTCSVCGKIESSDHGWNSGTVTKQPSCKEVGIRTYACSVCGGTKTEDIAKTNDHQYENWTGVNDAEHKRICSVCNYADISAHTWDSGTITKKPTCKESGVRQYTCTVCGSTGTEQIEMLSTHTYDHECDTDCNVCGALRTVKHKNNTVWSSNKEGHWHACSECGDKSDFEPHTPGEAATESTPQICTKCGYIIQAALGHNHSFEDTWSTDMDGHWYACVGCGELDSYAAHSFDNLCDTNCNVCGYMRTTAHSFDDTWLNNADNHWHECANCGETDSVAPHTPGPVATTSAPQTCTVCGYELAPRVEEETEPAVIPEESTVKEEKPNPTEIVEDMEKTPVREFNFIRWILIWLACATVALVIILKKR